MNRMNDLRVVPAIDVRNGPWLGRWVTNDLAMTDLALITYDERAWQIEGNHRGLKQATQAGRGPVRLARSVRTHIGFVLRAHVRLETHRYAAGVTGFEPTRDFLRYAACADLKARLFIARRRNCVVPIGSQTGPDPRN